MNHPQDDEILWKIVVGVVSLVYVFSVHSGQEIKSTLHKYRERVCP